MSSRPRRRVSLPTGKNYHFNVIYNNAKSKLSKTPDTELSLKVTEFFIEQAKGWGYDMAYYVDRDALPGQNIFTELFTVIDSSMFTIVILTNGFLCNCWAQYCQQSAFKSLLDSSGSEPLSTSKMIPVLIGVSDKAILRNLSLNRYVSFTTNDWITDKKEWNKVQQMMKDVTHIPGQSGSFQDLNQTRKHPIQETESPASPGTSTTHIAQAEDPPSLNQFNRPPPETDGPSSSFAAHGRRTQREKSQRQNGQRSTERKTQETGVGGASTDVGGASANVGGASAGVGGVSAGVGGVSARGTASKGSPQTTNNSSKGPNQTQEQDLLRREMRSTTHVIQAEPTTTTFSPLPTQQFISSPPGPTISMPVEASPAVREPIGQQRQGEVARLDSRNLSNDMPTVGQSRSSKVIPPDDISGNLRWNPPASPDETLQKQPVNTVTTGAAQSTDSGIGSTDTTPSPSLDPFSAMTYQFEESLSSPQEEISEELQTKFHRETTFTNQMSAPPNTQITKTEVSQDHSETPTSQLPGHMSNSEAESSIGFNRNTGMSETGDASLSDRIFDSIGSLQNQSDLDLDQGSFPSGEVCPTAVLDAKSQSNHEASPKVDHSNHDQTSARGDNPSGTATENLLEQAADHEEPSAMHSDNNTSTVSLSSSTHPIEEEEDSTSDMGEQLASDKEETILQKLSEPEFDKSQEAGHKSDTGRQPAEDSPMQSNNKSEGGIDLQKTGDGKLYGSSGPMVSSLTNGKPRTRRASMSDLARPAMHMFGNWILKPTLHVITGADQLYI